MNIRKFLNQDAVYWAPSSVDQYGNQTYTNPVDKKIRVVIENKVKSTPTSDTVSKNAKILSVDTLLPLGAIALGTLDDLDTNFIDALQTMVNESIDDSSSGGLELGNGRIIVSRTGSDILFTVGGINADIVNDTLSTGVFADDDSLKTTVSIDTPATEGIGAVITFEDIKSLVEEGDPFYFTYNGLTYVGNVGEIAVEQPVDNGGVAIRTVLPYVDRRGNTVGYEITTETQITISHPGAM